MKIAVFSWLQEVSLIYLISDLFNISITTSIGSKIYVFHLVYEASMNLNDTEWLVEMDWKKGFLKNIESYF